MNYEALYRAALLLALRHTVMLPQFVAHWVFGKRECGTFLKRMTDAGSIRQHNTRTETAVNGKSWFQPTVGACKEFGFPASRASQPSPEAMVSHLAALWVCFAFLKRSAHRLEAAEVVEVLGVEMPANVTFVLEQGAAWRLLVTQRDTSDAVLATRQIHDELSAEPKLQGAIAGGHLGVCLCVETELLGPA